MSSFNWKARPARSFDRRRTNLAFPYKPLRQPMSQTTAADGQRYRVVTTRIVSGGHEYDALVASSLADVDALLTDFRQWLWTMIPVILISACLGGYWVSRRALAPVDG